MKVLVYLPEEKLAPKGGPLAVGYYYFEEMKRRGDTFLEFNHVDVREEENRKKNQKRGKFLPKCLNEWQRIFRRILRWNKFLNGKVFAPERDFSEYDIIHFHETRDMYLERENLKNYRGIVVYQSHSPLPWGQEQYRDLPKIYEMCLPGMKEKFEIMDRYCFERADYIVFPCPEAEEPYFDNWPFYKTFKKHNTDKYRYVLTGIMPSFAKESRESVLQKYNVPTDEFVMCYVGRHNSVKGYDLLKEIASIYFEIDEKSWVISAGFESPFTRLEHPRWKEIGFTNDPHSLISACDVFVLPNRVTYFDIVMIEILSLGKIVITSRTGGNRFFEKAGLKGVLLYDTTDEAVDIIQKVRKMTSEERAELGKENAEFYRAHLSNVAMYDSYSILLKSLIKEQ